MQLRHKKAFLSFGMIITIAILTFSLILIIGLWQTFLSKADDVAAEKLCESFNAVRVFSAQTTLGHKFYVIPNACRTIDKGVLPEEAYPKTKKATKENIARLMTTCWQMWLEGREKNMFADNWPFGNDKCNICYTFSIDKGIDFTMVDLELFFDNTIYFAEDASQKCAPTEAGYSGGFCREKNCETDEKQISSTKCKAGEFCCIQKDRDNECKNKGGNCRPLTNGCNQGEKEFIPPKGWSCKNKEDICCINEEKVFSYREYIQSYGGGGKLIYNPGNLKFANPGQYAITFVSPGRGCDATCLGAIAGTGVAVTAAIYFTGGIALPLVIGGLGAGATSEYLTIEPEINAILITPLDYVADKCSIQEGVS